MTDEDSSVFVSPPYKFLIYIKFSILLILNLMFIIYGNALFLHKSEYILFERLAEPLLLYFELPWAVGGYFWKIARLNTE